MGPIKVLIVFLFLTTSLLFVTFFIDFLPSDNNMINKFKNNEEWFVGVVKAFQEYLPEKGQSHSPWNNPLEVKEMMLKADIRGVHETRYKAWVDDPYTLSSAIKIREMILNNEYQKVRYRNSDLVIRMNPRSNYISFNLFFFRISKDYVYFPYPPRERDGYIEWPFNLKSKPSVKRVVKENIDLPFSWERRSCVYRQIKPQWYLRVCSLF